MRMFMCIASLSLFLCSPCVSEDVSTFAPLVDQVQAQQRGALALYVCGNDRVRAGNEVERS